MNILDPTGPTRAKLPARSSVNTPVPVLSPRELPFTRVQVLRLHDAAKKKKQKRKQEARRQRSSAGTAVSLDDFKRITLERIMSEPLVPAANTRMKERKKRGFV